MKPPTVFLGEMTTLEVEAFLKEHHTVIIPVGATEQHGPHGPLLTDVLIPQEVARRAAPRLNAVVAPPVNYALSYPHVGFTGLVYLRIPTFMSMIEDLAAAFGAVGFKRIIFLNGHYDNTYALAYACANAAERLPEDARAYPLNYWDGCRRRCARSIRASRRGCMPMPPRRRRFWRSTRSWWTWRRRTPSSRTSRRSPSTRRRCTRRSSLEPAVGDGDEIGHVGRCPLGQSADRRGVHRGRFASTIAVIENVEKTFAAIPRRP